MKKFLILIALALTAILLISGCTQTPPANGNGTGGNGGTITKPKTPANLTAIGGNKLIELDWEKSATSGIDGYYIYRGIISGKNYLKVKTLSAGITTYEDNGLTNGLTYYYVVKAFIGETESDNSNEAHATPKETGIDQNQSGITDFERLKAECEAQQSALKRDVCFEEKGIESKDGRFCELMKSLSPSECFTEIATDSNSSIWCEKISVDEVIERNNCFNLMALQLNDKSLCYKLSETSVTSTLTDDCLKAVAESSGQKEECGGITDRTLKDQCYYTLALEFKDEELCLKISNIWFKETGYKRDNCLDELLKKSPTKESICWIYLDANKSNNCFESIAKTALDYTFCQKIRNDENKMNSCIEWIAIKKKDSTICNAIINEEKKQFCLNAVANISPSVELCSQLTDLSQRDDCYYTVAIAETDPTGCERMVVNLDDRDECFKKLAISMKRPDLCGKIRVTKIAERYVCYSAVALIQTDTSICEYIFSPAYYIPCYSDIALQLNDSAVCATIVKQFQTIPYISEDGCYYNYAFETNDSAVCIKIKNAAMKADCDANVTG